MSPHASLWIAAYAALIAFFLAVLLLLSAKLGERHRDPGTAVPYESGVLPTGSARLHFVARFYPVGILFVIFDVESVFLFAWAIAVSDLGWSAYFGGLVFAVMIVLPLLYLVRAGALESIAPRVRSRHG